MDLKKALYGKGILKKKAVLFSLISVLFSVLFITVYSSNFNTMYEDRIPGSNIRIKVMDNYARNFESYVASSVKISGYKILDGLTQNIATGMPAPLDHKAFNDTFANCMKCGRNICPGGSYTCVNGNQYLTGMLDTITATSLQQLNINTNYTINSIGIEQNYPFEVQVIVNLSYKVTDNSSTKYYAQWTKNVIISQPISIIGLNDPTGFKYGESYNRRIVRYTGLCEFDEACWTSDVTSQFFNERKYRYYTNGTSFLERYWNSNNPSDCCGIETIIHPNELVPPTENDDRNYIDHNYWSGGSNCSNSKMVTVIMNGESITFDQSTAARYGVMNISTVRCTP
jgi:hypothetical protein